jgi:hypothetical protein
MKITILLEKAANLTGGHRGNGDGQHDLCSLRILLFSSALFVWFASTALAATHYVDITSTNATPPYTNWATAATNIQDAVDAAVAGDEIVVTNGTYATGGRANPGDTAPNRVAVDKPLSIRSLNGPQFTTIDGGYSGRCVSLRAYGASLSGFTLIHGIAYAGGGLYCGNTWDAVVSNCVITGNQVVGDNCSVRQIYGGGAFGGTLNNCTLTSNSVSAELLAEPLCPTDLVEADGGGAAYCTLNNCTLSGNSANATNSGNFDTYRRIWASGGGAYVCTLNNCALVGNSVVADDETIVWPELLAYSCGGGAAYCTLNNCTLTGNSALSVGFHSNADGGGASICTLNNCIVYFNTASGSPNYDSNSTLNYCCTPYFAGDLGNITNAPLFVDGNGWANLRLQSNSPCINAGNNPYAPAGPDLDGNPRIVGGTVDIGAYEYQSLSLINFNVVLNQAGFDITGQSNQIVTVETSSDLVNWSPLATNTLNGHPFPFSDPTPTTLPRRFYRAQAQ